MYTELGETGDRDEKTQPRLRILRATLSITEEESMGYDPYNRPAPAQPKDVEPADG